MIGVSKRGHLISSNNFIESIIRKFDQKHRSFLACNVLAEGNTIFCSEGFVAMFGYSKAEVLMKNKGGRLQFLQGPLTSPQAVNLIEEAMKGEIEKRIDILLYKKNGESFLCYLSICPVKDSSGEVSTIILDFDDPSKKTKEEETKASSKLVRAKASFRQSFRLKSRPHHKPETEEGRYEGETQNGNKSAEEIAPVGGGGNIRQQRRRHRSGQGHVLPASDAPVNAIQNRDRIDEEDEENGDTEVQDQGQKVEVEASNVYSEDSTTRNERKFGLFRHNLTPIKQSSEELQNESSYPRLDDSTLVIKEESASEKLSGDNWPSPAIEPAIERTKSLEGKIPLMCNQHINNNSKNIKTLEKFSSIQRQLLPTPPALVARTFSSESVETRRRASMFHQELSFPYPRSGSQGQLERLRVKRNMSTGTYPILTNVESKELPIIDPLATLEQWKRGSLGSQNQNSKLKMDGTLWDDPQKPLSFLRTGMS